MSLEQRPTCSRRGIPAERRRVVAQLTGDVTCIGDLPDDRRCRIERRRSGLYSVLYGAFRPRRRSARRSDDPGSLLDWYDSLLLLPILGILVLSMTDGMLTLNLLEAGGRELNIVMARLIEADPQLFAAVKMALTSAGVVVLAACARLRLLGRLRVSHLMYVFLGGYVVLICYELYLISLLI